MAVARSVLEVFDYVLESERSLPPSEQTVFTLRRLSTRQQIRAQALTTNQPAMAEFVLRVGISGWRNFADSAGKPVPCVRMPGVQMVEGIAVTEPLSPECLDLLPLDATTELLTAIIEGNTLTASDAKN